MKELWFRSKYLKYIKNKQIVLTVREGRRDEFHPKGYKIGERVLLRCFDIPGINEFRTIIVITKLVFKKIRDLTPNDLIGGPLDFLTNETAKKSLEILYNRKFSDDEIVTLIYFRYGDLTYSLDLYTPCNQKCKMCHADDFKQPLNQIDFKAIKEEIIRVKMMGYKRIDFVGSEPTMYPRLFEAISYSKKLRLKPAIFTNGYRLSSVSYVKRLATLKPIGIKTSFHSHREEIFDYITSTPGSYLNFLKALGNIRKYLSTAPSRTNGLLVNIVINRYNYKNLPEMVQFLYNRNVKRVKLTQLLLLGNLYNNPDSLIDLKEVYPYFVRAVSLMKKLGMCYDFDSFPICFMESENRHFNPMYDAGKGLKLIYCDRCQHNERCPGIPKTQIILRYKKQLLKAKESFPEDLFERIFTERDVSFIKALG